ncbi:MAG: hypothetical protein AVDCRST_MAG41-4416, partial [uncultured Corynebacteriales bacterium]
GAGRVRRSQRPVPAPALRLQGPTRRPRRPAGDRPAHAFRRRGPAPPLPRVGGGPAGRRLDRGPLHPGPSRPPATSARIEDRSAAPAAHRHPGRRSALGPAARHPRSVQLRPARGRRRPACPDRRRHVDDRRPPAVDGAVLAGQRCGGRDWSGPRPLAQRGMARHRRLPPRHAPPGLRSADLPGERRPLRL